MIFFLCYSIQCLRYEFLSASVLKYCHVLQLAIESVRSEYMNAQLECHAADERAKILTSEVISLEEKVLPTTRVLFFLLALYIEYSLVKAYSTSSCLIARRSERIACLF